MKETIIIWTPDLPEGYGAFDYDNEADLIDEEEEDEDND